MNSEWVEEIQSTIENQKENIHKRDRNFFQVDQLIRIAERLDQNEKDCLDCKVAKRDLEEISNHLAGLINGSPKMKRDLENKTDKIKKHLKLVHQIYPVYYFVSYYSFLGLVLGAGAGALAGLISLQNFYVILAIFTIAGLVTGYFMGTKKDWKVRYDKRLL